MYKYFNNRTHTRTGISSVPSTCSFPKQCESYIPKTMPDRNISTHGSSHFYNSIDFNRQSHRWHPRESTSWVRFNVFCGRIMCSAGEAGELTTIFLYT